MAAHRPTAPGPPAKGRSVDWQDLHHFLVLARTGSFAAAAKELGVDQATVGRRLTALEAAMGLSLAERGRRSVKLSAEGIRFAEAASSMERIAQTLAQHVRPLQGKVTITAAPVVALEVIAPTLQELLQKQPQLKISIRSMPERASLKAGDADIAIGTERPAEPDLIARRLGTVRYGLYCQPGYETTDEASWSFIGSDRDYDHIPLQSWLRDYAAGRSYALETNDVLIQQKAACAGAGIAILPRTVADRDPGLIRLPMRPGPPERPMWISIRAEDVSKAAIVAVMDHLAYKIEDRLSEAGG